MTRVYGILLAAGLGTRLGASKPKAFIEYKGEPILSRSYRLISNTRCCDSLIVTVPEALVHDPLCEVMRSEGAIIMAGGMERQDSVALALDVLARHVSPNQTDLVLIHDAARCNVTPEIICRVIDVAKECGAATVGIPSIDSLKEVDDSGRVTRSLDRSRVWRVQTPQVFRYDLIVKAHTGGIRGVTDDASLVERFHPVQMVMGDESNIKITTPADLR